MEVEELDIYIGERIAWALGKIIYGLIKHMSISCLHGLLYFKVLFVCHDISRLGGRLIKWRQRANTTIVVDQDVKQQVH